jgi:hypothetical protein
MLQFIIQSLLGGRGVGVWGCFRVNGLASATNHAVKSHAVSSFGNLSVISISLEGVRIRKISQSISMETSWIAVTFLQRYPKLTRHALLGSYFCWKFMWLWWPVTHRRIDGGSYALRIFSILLGIISCLLLSCLPGIIWVSTLLASRYFRIRSRISG